MDRQVYQWLKRNATQEILNTPKKANGRAIYYSYGAWERLIRYQWRLEGDLGNMAKKQENPPAWVGFANVRLSDSDKENFAAWDMEMDDCWEMLIARCVEGYKFTVTYNEQNKSYVCSLTCNVKRDPNAGYTLTGYAPDVATAMRVLVFKDEVLAAHGEWPKERQGAGGIG